MIDFAGVLATDDAMNVHISGAAVRCAEAIADRLGDRIEDTSTSPVVADFPGTGGHHRDDALRPIVEGQNARIHLR